MTSEARSAAPYVPEISLRDALAGVQRVVLTAHVDPDPDGLGSALGLAHVLRREGWEVLPICVGTVPSFTSALPGADLLRAFPSRLDDGPAPAAVLHPTDALVVMDTPVAARMAAFYDFHRDVLPQCKVIVFDHHYTNEGYGDVNYVDPRAAATAEVIVDVLDHSAIALDQPGAVCLMTALLADTQCFRTENTSARSLLLGHRLASAGAPIYPLAELLFKTRPVAGLRLWGVALSQVATDDGIAWTAITAEMLRETGATMEEAEGLVDFILSTRGTSVAMVLKEDYPGETKVSMRTVTGVDATRVVSVFGGGGHQRAAGCTILAAPEEAAHQILPLVRDEIRRAGLAEGATLATSG